MGDREGERRLAEVRFSLTHLRIFFPQATIDRRFAKSQRYPYVLMQEKVAWISYHFPVSSSNNEAVHTQVVLVGLCSVVWLNLFTLSSNSSWQVKTSRDNEYKVSRQRRETLSQNAFTFPPRLNSVDSKTSATESTVRRLQMENHDMQLELFRCSETLRNFSKAGERMALEARINSEKLTRLEKRCATEKEKEVTVLRDEIGGGGERIYYLAERWPAWWLIKCTVIHSEAWLQKSCQQKRLCLSLFLTSLRFWGACLALLLLLRSNKSNCRFCTFSSPEVACFTITACQCSFHGVSGVTETVSQIFPTISQNTAEPRCVQPPPKCTKPSLCDNLHNQIKQLRSLKQSSAVAEVK